MKIWRYIRRFITKANCKLIAIIIFLNIIVIVPAYYATYYKGMNNLYINRLSILEESNTKLAIKRIEVKNLIASIEDKSRILAVDLDYIIKIQKEAKMSCQENGERVRLFLAKVTSQDKGGNNANNVQ
jgi:hypothetical protein